MRSNRRAFVAGGSGALGKSVCRALLDAGYEVHASASSEGSDINHSPGLEGVVVHVVDFTVEADAARVFADVGKPLHALISTVGGFRGGPLAEVTSDDIDHLLALNLKTTLLILKSAHPYLMGVPGGAGVVVTAARGAIEGGPGSSLYAATKAAVANLALSAAREWNEDGIRVNAILPSTMDTRANRVAMPTADHTKWPTTDQVAAVAVFLVGEWAEVVSGAAVPVYGTA